jgi:predicted outer membrane repeat protein
MRKMYMFKWLFVTALMIAVTVLNAQTVYLSENGNDANSGEDLANAMATLGAAYAKITDASGTIYVSGKITVTAEVAIVGKAITIEKESTATTAIFDGANSTRFLTYAGGSNTLTLRNLTFQNGLYENNATAPAIGGGAMAMTNGNLVAEFVIFYKNKATTTLTTGDGNQGGAVFIGGTGNNGGASFTNCEFIKNESDRFGAVSIRNAGNGATVLFKNCYFSGNKSLVYGGGSAINFRANSTGVIFNIINCTMTGNTILHSATGAGSGGGALNFPQRLWGTDSPATVNIVNTTITGNTSNQLNEFPAGIYYRNTGGQASANFYIRNSIIAGNTNEGTNNDFSLTSSPADLPITITTEHGYIKIENSIIGAYSTPASVIAPSNRLASQIGTFEEKIDPKLGAFDVTGNFFPLAAGSPAIETGDGTLALVEAFDQVGNARSTTGPCNMGSVEVVESAGTIDVTGITVRALGDATTITTVGGTLQMIATVLPVNADDKTVTWSVNDENIATIDAEGLLKAKTDGVVTVTATAKDGSAVTGTMDITISGQTTSDVPGSKIFISYTGDDANNGTTALLAVKSFSRAQELATSGGVIHVSGMIDFSTDPENAGLKGISLDKDLIVKGTSNETDGFDGKSLTRFIQSNEFSLTLKDLKLTGGATAENGGALKLAGSTVIIENVIFDSNTALRGGAIYAASGSLSLDGCTILNNDNSGITLVDGETTILSSGGAIYVTPEAALSMDVKNTVIKNNKTGGHGAAIFYVDNAKVASTMKFTNCAIISNSSGVNSVGAIFVNNNVAEATIELSFINSTISKNLAGGPNGGAMRVDNAQTGSSIALVNCTVTENQITGTSAAGGAGIRILKNVTDNGGKVKIYNTIIENNYCPGVAYSNINYTGDFAWQGEGFTPGTTLIIENSMLGRPGSPANAKWQAAEFSSSKMNYVAVLEGDVRNSYLAKFGEFNTTHNYYPLMPGSFAIDYGLSTHLQSLTPTVNTDQVGNIRPFKDGKCHAGAVEIVFSSTIAVTGITVSAADNATTITTDGGTLQMIATVLPDDATDASVTWSVNDAEMATIDANGLLTAKADGAVTVTATANDGSKIKGSMDITISGQSTPDIKVTEITVTGDGGATTITANAGTLKIIATVAPSNANNATVTWSVNNEAIATIDTNGLLTAVSNGEVTVTATAKDGSGITGMLVITITNQGTTVWESAATTKIINIYPNPATTDILYLQNVTNADVEIYSITGQMVIARSKVSDVNIQELKPGIYFVKINADGIIQTRKLIRK